MEITNMVVRKSRNNAAAHGTELFENFQITLTRGEERNLLVQNGEHHMRSVSQNRCTQANKPSQTTVATARYATETSHIRVTSETGRVRTCIRDRILSANVEANDLLQGRLCNREHASGVGDLVQR
jgi:hypothetical protein